MSINYVHGSIDLVSGHKIFTIAATQNKYRLEISNITTFSSYKIRDLFYLLISKIEVLIKTKITKTCTIITISDDEQGQVNRRAVLVKIQDLVSARLPTEASWKSLEEWIEDEINFHYEWDQREIKFDSEGRGSRVKSNLTFFKDLRFLPETSDDSRFKFSRFNFNNVILRKLRYLAVGWDELEKAYKWSSLLGLPSEDLPLILCHRDTANRISRAVAVIALKKEYEAKYPHLKISYDEFADESFSVTRNWLKVHLPDGSAVSLKYFEEADKEVRSGLDANMSPDLINITLGYFSIH